MESDKTILFSIRSKSGGIYPSELEFIDGEWKQKVINPKTGKKIRGKPNQEAYDYLVRHLGYSPNKFSFNSGDYEKIRKMPQVQLKKYLNDYLAGISTEIDSVAGEKSNMNKKRSGFGFSVITAGLLGLIGLADLGATVFLSDSFSKAAIRKLKSGEENMVYAIDYLPFDKKYQPYVLDALPSLLVPVAISRYFRNKRRNS